MKKDAFEEYVRSGNMQRAVSRATLNAARRASELGLPPAGSKNFTVARNVDLGSIAHDSLPAKPIKLPQFMLSALANKPEGPAGQR